MLRLVQPASQCVAVEMRGAASGCWRTAGWHCVHVMCCAPGCRQPHSPASGTASKSDWKSASSRGSVPLQDSKHTQHSTHTTVSWEKLENLNPEDVGEDSACGCSPG